MESLWDMKEVSKFLKLGETKIQKMVNEGVIPSLLIGRKRRYRPEQIKAYVEQTQLEQTATD